MLWGFSFLVLCIWCSLCFFCVGMFFLTFGKFSSIIFLKIYATNVGFFFFIYVYISKVCFSHGALHFLSVLSCVFRLFYISCQFVLDPLLYFLVLIFHLLMIHFTLSFLVKLLGFSIPSSFQLEPSLVFLSPNWIPFSSLWLVFVIFVKLMFVFSWASLRYLVSSSISLISLNCSFVLPLNSLKSLGRFMIVLLTMCPWIHPDNYHWQAFLQDW